MLQAILHNAESYTAIAIFVATYLFIAVGKLPGYHLDRAGAALLGACLMVWLGVLSLEEAFAAIDFDTIALLLGMMIVVANLRLSGFFELVNEWVVVRTRRPLVLLAAIVFLAGVLSAFLVNDTICLVMTPLVLDVTLRLRRNPVPYLLAVALASTLAGNFTLVGSVANLIVAQRAQGAGVTISFWAYFKVGAPLTILTILFGIWWL